MRRLKRILKGHQKRCLLIALDHGPWLGPVQGIDHPTEIVKCVLDAGATALLMTPGFTKTVEHLLSPTTGVICRVSIAMGLSEEATQETPIATVETALRLDADAVAVSIFFGQGREVPTMRFLGELAESCFKYQLPVVAEMIPAGDKFYDAEAIAHASRIGYEMGADLLKTSYCGEIEAFKQVLTASPIPVLVAGGPSSENGDESTFKMVQEIVDAGASGVAFGRRVWQADDPQKMVRGIHKILFAE